MSEADKVIQESLIARINQLTAQVSDLEHKLALRKQRAWALRVGVNNLMCLASDETRKNYQHLLDEDDDR